MPLFKTFILLATTLVVFNACTNKAEEANTTTEKTAPTIYTYNPDSTYVGFVAYKFNEKVGVPGQFTQFNAEGIPSTINSAKDLANNLSFTIDIASLETGIEDRNEKIKEHFFQTINTSTIKGKILELEGEENAGIARVELEMNGLTKTAYLNYQLIDQIFELKGTINVEIWDALSGIEALNKACYILHQGSDGISKLWPTVDIDVKTVLLN